MWLGRPSKAHCLRPDPPDVPSHRSFTLLTPGDWDTPTGGYRYLRAMAGAMRAAGWGVNVLRIDANWPEPDAAALARAAAAVSALPDGTRVLADGLAFGVLDAVIAPHAQRLRWVALVHHPLHLETGLAAAQKARLLRSETQALARAQRVVVTSASTQQDVVAIGVPLSRVAVVEPGTDRQTAACASAADPPKATSQAMLQATLQEPASGGHPVRLLCVATVTPRKGHGLLLQALEGLVDLNWTLHCVGSLTRAAATAAAAQAHSQKPALAGRVVWHGEVDPAALQAHYRAADLLVLPSRHEGYGMAVAEALSFGLPVLASSAGALAQTLPPGAGWQAPPDDVPAWQAALRRLLTDAALRARLAAGARAAGQNLPTWAQQAERLAAVLQSVP